MPRKNRTGRIRPQDMPTIQEEPQKQPEIIEKEPVQQIQEVQAKPKRQPKEKKEKKEKKPRPYSFISAFSDWRKGNVWSGLCPKKGSEEYNQIRAIYDQHRKA